MKDLKNSKLIALIKNTILGGLLLLITWCAYGGGCLIWTTLALLIQPSPIVNEILFFTSAIVPMPFCWWIAPKIADKFF